MRSLWRKNRDKPKALLEYRAFPLPGIDSITAHFRTQATNDITNSSKSIGAETHSTQKVKARKKHGKDKQKYHRDRQGTKELPPLRSCDHVRVKPEQGSKEWRAVTVVQKYDLPKSYVVEAGGQRIRCNRVALRNDSTKSPMGYRKSHRNIVQQTEPEPEKNICGSHIPSKPTDGALTTGILLKSLSC